MKFSKSPSKSPAFYLVAKALVYIQNIVGTLIINGVDDLVFIICKLHLFVAAEYKVLQTLAFGTVVTVNDGYDIL